MSISNAKFADERDMNRNSSDSQFVSVVFSGFFRSTMLIEISENFGERLDVGLD